MIKWILRILIAVSAGTLVYYFLPEQKLPPHKKIDKLVVYKSKRIMEAYSKGELLKRYKISIGQVPVGDKQGEGDKKTPEGHYTINDKNPNSGFHKNLGISYPSQADIAEARSKGLSPGGEVKIHGLKSGQGFIGKFHRMLNWTAGCIAVTDEEIDELYAHVKIRTPITINP
jgi:murein L,D-transpeptidase YafK